MTRPRRCLVVESLPYHWEVLPPWVALLRRLGYEVEVAGCDDTAGHQETLAMLEGRCRRRRLDELKDVAAGEFDFVVLNTLVHEGYVFDNPPQPRPNLKWLKDLGLPSISVVHEPVHWVEKRIVHAFEEAGPDGRQQLKLLGDGYLQYGTGPWSVERWSLQGDRLVLSGDGWIRTFETADGGRSYRGLGADGAITLTRQPVVDEDLAGHCADGRHAVITLTPAGAQHLAAVCDGATWILPFELRDRLPARADGEIAFAGVIDYDRKRIPSLLTGCEALGEGRYIRIIGGSRSVDFDQDRFVRGFRHELAERGLAGKFKFTGYLPYGEFVERIRSCRFLLPLVDDYVDAGYYLIKLPAAVAASLSLGVPLIVNELIAEKFGLQYMICYAGDDLASGLEAERRLDAEGYAAMVQTLDRHAEELDRRNIDVLAGLIGAITGRDPRKEA